MRNYVLLIISIFNIIVGIVGLCGYRFYTPDEYCGYGWTKKYIKGRGLIYFILGVSCLAAFFIMDKKEVSFKEETIIILAVCLPYVILSIYHSIKYKRLLRKEQKTTMDKAQIRIGK